MRENFYNLCQDVSSAFIFYKMTLYKITGLNEENSIIFTRPSLQTHTYININNHDYSPPTFGAQQLLAQTTTPDESKKKIKEAVREKKEMKITQGRKPRIICDREVALQLANQLSC